MVIIQNLNAPKVSTCIHFNFVWEWQDFKTAPPPPSPTLQQHWVNVSCLLEVKMTMVLRRVYLYPDTVFISVYGEKFYLITMVIMLLGVIYT